MIRRNFLAAPEAARAYLDGVTRLKDPALFPWPGQPGLSIYDVFVFWHHQSMMLMTPPNQFDRNAAHSGPAFLPWHRYFLLTLEGFLRRATADQDFRIPYWDWAADAVLPDPRTSAIWSGANLGQFAGPSWPVRLALSPISGNLERVNRPLRRNLAAGGALPGRDRVRAVVRDEAAYDAPPFDSSTSVGMRNTLEGWVGPARIHNDVHVWIGGDMGLSSSPNDPAFFLHHANVDRIWAAWQQAHPGSPYVPDMSASTELQFHRIDDPLHSIFDEVVSAGDMLDYQPRYRYDALADLL